MPKKLLSRFNPAVLFAFALGLSFSSHAAPSVTLQWDPNTEPTLAGYRLYFGTQSRGYVSTVNVPAPLTVATASNLISGATYFFAVTAYDLTGAESDFSAEISYTVPGNANATPVALSMNVAASIDQSRPITLLANDADGDALSFAVTSLPANGALSGTPPNLVYTPRAGFVGFDAFRFVARDTLTSSAPATVSISVNSLNAAPTLNAMASVNLVQNSGPRTVALSGISSGSTNEMQPLTVTATSSNPTLIPTPAISYASPNTTGTLTFTPAPNAWGTATITVTVNDNQGTNNTIRRFFVVRINNPPTLNALPNLTVNEDAPTQIVALSGISSGAANEAQPLFISAVSSDPALIPNPTISYNSPNSTGTLSFQPVANASGAARITVTVRDGQLANGTISRSFIVTVNSAPPDIANLKVVRDDARGFAVTWTTDKPATCSVDFGATPALGSSLPAISVSTNHLAVLSGLQPSSTYYVRFRAADLAGSETLTDVFTIDTPAAMQLTWPAETGLLNAPMEIGTSTAARGGRYVSSSTAEAGSVVYDVSVPVGFSYRLWCRVQTPPTGASLYASVDGGTAVALDILGSATSQWRWVLLRDRESADEPVVFNLHTGPHQITLSGGTANAFIDDLMLVNDPEWSPITDATAPVLRANGATATSIDIAWNDSFGNESGFMLESSSDGVSFAPLVFLGPGITSYRHNVFAASMRYYRVSAFNDVDMTPFSNTAGAQPANGQLPLAPAGLNAFVDHSSAVRLQWIDSASNETGFLVEQSFDGVNFSAVRALSENATSTTDVPTRYGWIYYRVRALNGAGFSDPSGVTVVLF